MRTGCLVAAVLGPGSRIVTVGIGAAGRRRRFGISIVAGSDSILERRARLIVADFDCRYSQVRVELRARRH